MLIYGSHPDDFELVDGSKLYPDYRCDEEGAIVLNELEARYVERAIIELTQDDRVASMVDPVKVLCFPSHVDLIIRGGFLDVKQGLSRLKSRVATLVAFKFQQRDAKLWSKGFWAAELDSKSNLFKELKSSTIT